MDIEQKALEAGVYSFRDMQSLGFIKDRTDLHRKQRKYGFPLPVKLGDRQAVFLREEVHIWFRHRAAVTAALRDEQSMTERNGRAE
jgi:predicted DNA-binding transcriptional regulator AlpA